MRGSVVRMISARKANARETREYERNAHPSAPNALSYCDLSPAWPSPMVAASEGRRLLTSWISTSKSSDVSAIALAVRRNSGTFGVR